MAIKKTDRQIVFQKYGGRCAYCGKLIDIKDMQVDHIKPVRLGESMDIIIEVVKYNTDDVSEGIKLFNTLKYLFRYGKKERGRGP